MQGIRAPQWRRSERRSGTLFLVAGILWLAVVFVVGSRQFLLVDPTPGLRSNLLLTVATAEWLSVGLVSLALLVAALGLFGLYPLAVDRSPGVSFAGAAAGAFAAATGVLLAWGLVALVLVASPPPGAAVPAVGTIAVLGFGSFGVASLYTGVPSRTVGGLLVLSPVLLVGFVVARGRLQVGVGVALVAVTLAIGRLLRVDVSSRARE